MMDGEPEAYKDESLRSIAISPRERLERIEALLAKMDEKLDIRFDSIEKRMNVVERVQDGCGGLLEAVKEHGRLDHHYGAASTEEFEQLSKVVDGIRTRMWMAIGGLAALIFVVNFGIAQHWF